MWIEYETEFGKQYVNSETQENIQAYGGDKRYPEFAEKIAKGEIVPVAYVAPDMTVQLEQQKIKAEIAVIEQSALRNLLALSKGEIKAERDYLNNKIAQIEILRSQLK